MISTTGSIIVPLAADFTTANIPDNQIYSTVTCSLPVTITRETYYMSQILDMMIMNCTISSVLDFRLVCPVQRYKSTSADRIKLIKFYKSKVGQAIYSLRSTSIEPLIEHIKSVFRIDPLPVRGYDKACAAVHIVSLAVPDTCLL